MVTKVVYKGTHFSKLIPPVFTGLLERVVDLEFHASKISGGLELKIGVHLLNLELNGSQRFEVLKSQSVYDVFAKKPVKVYELYQIVKEAVDCLKGFPHASAADRQDFLTGIAYPTLSSVQSGLEGLVKHF